MLLTVPIREVLPATPRSRIVRLDLRDTVFPFAAGQALAIADHRFQPRKPYSIASSPEEAADRGWLELLVGVGADGTPGPHLRLQPGTLVDIDGPLGRFTYPTPARDERLLFIAGGTGIAPLRAMMRHALAQGPHRIGVLYSARTPDDFAYESELRDLARAGHIELRLTVTRETHGTWSDTRGRIGTELLGTLVHDPATLCFICGPRALVEEVPKALGALGVVPNFIRIEDW